MTTRTKRLSATLPAILTAALLAGCAEDTRIATENDGTQVSGQSVATALQQRLAQIGVPGASVSCAKTIIVNVGPRVSCNASAGSASKTVTFTFKTLDGKIDLPSVNVS
jgi:hypothetical protein